MRSAYRPGRIGRVWPPPQDENQPPPLVLFKTLILI